MKNLMLFLFFCNLFYSSYSQTTIDINTNMFVQLVFDSSIEDVKSGAPDLIFTNYDENSLNIQCLDTDIKTNISVKTTDGLFYSFLVEYKENIKDLFFLIPKDKSMNYKVKEKKIETKFSNKTSKKSLLENLIQKKGFIRNRNTKKYKKVYLTINGVYIKNEKIYFLFTIKNRSNISYIIENLNFISLPNTISKKSVNSKGKEYTPLFFYENLDKVSPKDHKKLIAVFDKFTINNQKKLVITLIEKNGERSVKLDINSNIISSAKPL